jgi:hypothetical protein
MFGAHAVIGMVMNAMFGALAAWSAYDLLCRNGSRRWAMACGLAVALHPALVPYTAALMTEGVTASLLIAATAFAQRARHAETRRSTMSYVVGVGLLLGVTTLVRPQSLVFAPLLGAFAVRADKVVTARRVQTAIVVSVLALLVCAPWTVRNCVRMQSCALVSVNGGWNLAIGTETTDGAWHALSVPDECKNVFAEADKDRCFGSAARRAIATAPWAWLAKVPAKLRVTFNYFGAAPWYLHAANPVRFSYAAKEALGALEVVACRLLLLGALVSVRTLAGPRRVWREATTAVGIAATFFPEGAVVGYLACALGTAWLGPRALFRGSLVVPMTALVIVATAATHAVFFGAGRYGLVVVPFVAALAFVRDERACVE